MSRPVRILLILAAAAGVLVLGAAIALPLLVDVNRYRPLLTDQIARATGRRVDVGSLSFRLLPTPRIAAGPIRVASARQPDKVVDLMMEDLSIRVAILPLLRGRLVVQSIRLDRPAVSLHRDSQGRWNFDDLLARRAAAGGSPEPAGASGFSVAVEKAVIRDGKLLIYDDRLVPGRRLKLEIAPIDATVEGWGHGGETRLDLEAGIGRSRLRARARLADRDGRPTLALNISSRGLRAEDVVLVFPWTGVVQPAGLEVGGGVDIQGEAALPLQTPEKVRFRGTLTLEDLRYRDAGMTRAIEGISGVVSVDGQKATLKDFAVRVGDSSLSGSLEVEDFLHPRVRFDLASPRLDFNQILALFAIPATGGPAAGGSTGGGSSGGASPRAPAAAAPDAAAGLITQLSGAGRLDLKAVRFQTFDLANVKASVSMADGTLALRDLKGDFYGGRLGGAADLTLGGPVPGYGLRIDLDAVDVEPLLAAYDPGLRGLLRGRLTGGLDLKAAGAEMDPILDSARGTGSLEIREGVLTSFSVLRQIATLLEVAGGKGIGREETPFEYLRGTLAIDDRRARTSDLSLHSTDLDLDGRGWVGLDATLDLNTAVRFSEDSTRGMVEKYGSLDRLVDAGRLAVHFNLNGSLASPGFRLDTRATTRQAVAGARDRAEKRLLDRIRGKLLDHIEKGEPPAGETPGEEAPPPAESAPGAESTPAPPGRRR